MIFLAVPSCRVLILLARPITIIIIASLHFVSLGFQQVIPSRNQLDFMPVLQFIRCGWSVDDVASMVLRTITYIGDTAMARFLLQEGWSARSLL